LVAVLLAAACGRPAALPAESSELAAKPADYIEVFNWSLGVPPGARPLEGPAATFKGPHFAYRFGALATRTSTDATSGSLEGGPARAADGHEFLILYRLRDDDTFSPSSDAPLTSAVVVGNARKRLPKPIEPGSALIASVPIGADATLEVTDDRPYLYSFRNGSGAITPRAGEKQVRWQAGDYVEQGVYQGVRTSGPLEVRVALGERAELGAALSGAGTPPAKHTWLRLPDAKISTDDAQLKVDLVRSIVLTLPDGTEVRPSPGAAGLLFAVPDPFTAASLTIAPEFPAGSTAKWTTRPQAKQVPLTVT
jgi:hypothetical protein